MFDIGFAELLVLGIVSLLVIGPERLPSTIRTASVYINRIRRGFNDLKQEVQQELHNDSVMQDLREASDKLKKDAASLGHDIQNMTDSPAAPGEKSETEDEASSAQERSDALGEPRK